MGIALKMFNSEKKELPIKWKLFAYFSAFSIIMLGLLWVFQILLLNDFYRAIKIREIYSTTQIIEKNINNENLDDVLTPLIKNRDVCISVFDKNGQGVWYSNVMMNCVIHKLPSSVLYSFASEAVSDTDTYFEEFGPGKQTNSKAFKVNRREFANSILLCKKVTDTSGNSFIIVLNSVIEPVFATTTTLRTQLIYITIVMIILSFLLSLIISKKIAKPIVNINNSAKRLPTDYNIKFEDKGYKEISELADTLTCASAELSKVENLRREFIANISHDLRTPLTMISGYAEVIRDLPGEDTSENIQVIIDESKRLTGLVNDMLDISKLQDGAKELNITTFSLTDMISGILKRYSKLIEKDGYIFKFEKQENVLVTADELKLTQVIYNLINNAITYTGEDKVITICQTVKDSTVKVEISDTGDGISEDEIPYIWDRYYKAKNSHKRAKVGTGLGLSIVKNILTLQKSNFGARNNERKGATFWFELKITF